MKLQYLGDSKDSFKWDYHDFLARETECVKLNIVLMMTPDDQSSEGNSHPSLFPARQEVLEFCEHLRNERNLDIIYQLPERTGSRYSINLHKNNTHITDKNREPYFSGFSNTLKQLILLDPDNGFEPEKSFSEKHVLYSDITQILQQISDESVISVFQHFRRKSFSEDFIRIRERLHGGYASAIYWHSLMFVSICRSKETNSEVIAVNQKYAKKYPVRVIA
jgi:hypothetical protein